MNKMNKLFGVFFLSISLVNYCSDSDSGDIASQASTEAAFVGNVGVIDQPRRIKVDWTELISELEKQGYIWDSSNSDTQEHGCGTDQSFVVFPPSFKDRPTHGLLALLNKNEKAIKRE